MTDNYYVSGLGFGLDSFARDELKKRYDNELVDLLPLPLSLYKKTAKFSLITTKHNKILLPSSMATNSSIDNDKKIEDVAEESGWTAYLEDFSCNDDGSFMSSSSLISDAAWNGSDGIRRMNLNKLKKSTNRRKYTYEYDNDLEDTASSPVNSPKVSTMKEVNHRRFNDIASSDFLGQQSSSNNSSKYERNTKKKNTSIIENKTLDQYTELKKRGLCLVPMSALINYIG